MGGENASLVIKELLKVGDEMVSKLYISIVWRVI